MCIWRRNEKRKKRKNRNKNSYLRSNSKKAIPQVCVYVYVWGWGVGEGGIFTNSDLNVRSSFFLQKTRISHCSLKYWSLGVEHSWRLTFDATFDHPITVHITYCNMLVCFQTNDFLWLKMMSCIRHEYSRF